MVPSNYRPSKIVVDLEAISSNIKSELNRLDKEQELFAVVKANAYGHGAVEVAKKAIASGASGLCVSNLNEALELREAGIKTQILILSYVSLDYLPLVIEHDLTLTAPSYEWLEELAKQTNEPVKIHLKIDTGMGRIGIANPDEMILANELLINNPLIIFEGLFTHFSKADSTDESYVALQQKRFIKALEIFGTDMRYIHTSNSATALWHNAWESNLIRFGDAMYGMNPSGNELVPPYELTQALTLETELIHVKEVKAGEKIGYGTTYETSGDEIIGTLPIGYADGLIRRFQGFDVLVNGKKAPIVGRVCMDQCMIRLEENLPVGTKVTIFGTNGELFNSVQQGAEHVGTINYEVTCGLTDRLPREFVGAV